MSKEVLGSLSGISGCLEEFKVFQGALKAFSEGVFRGSRCLKD